MILSVSRRTDIPRFYSQWFFNRLKEKFVLVKNPFNPAQVSRVSLEPEIIDCIAFWTKNPAPMLPRLDELREYNYYMQFTINGYPQQFETGLPAKAQLVDTFKKYTDRIGPDRMIWRYSPVLLAPGANLEFHKENFNYLASALNGYTKQVFISFLDPYKKIEATINRMGITFPTVDEKMELARIFKEASVKNNIKASSCGSDYKLLQSELGFASCVNKNLIEKITGYKTDLKRDKNQRPMCACAESIDIGVYNSCLNGCVYCYANNSINSVRQTSLKHDPDSPLLIGHVADTCKITYRAVRSHKIQSNIEDFLIPEAPL